MITIYKQLKPVSTSQNLRGILDYARTRNTNVRLVRIEQIADGKGMLQVTWADGARAITDFADYNVLADWCKGRRSWPMAQVL
jgi:hypothetical protein